VEQEHRHFLFDELRAGHGIRELDKGRISSAHLVRWSAASENWHRIHYDQEFAKKHEGLGDIVINGSLKQNWIADFLVSWLKEDGVLWSLSLRFSATNYVNESLSVWGRVDKLVDGGEYGVVKFNVGIVNSSQVESTPGTATAILRKRESSPLSSPLFPDKLNLSPPAMELLLGELTK